MLADGKSKGLTTADPQCRDWMSNGRPWQRLTVAPSAAMAELARRSRLTGKGSPRCRWPVALGLHKAGNSLVSSHCCGDRTETHDRGGALASLLA